MSAVYPRRFGNNEEQSDRISKARVVLRDIPRGKSDFGIYLHTPLVESFRASQRVRRRVRIRLYVFGAHVPVPWLPGRLYLHRRREALGESDHTYQSFAARRDKGVRVSARYRPPSERRTRRKWGKRRPSARGRGKQDLFSREARPAEPRRTENAGAARERILSLLHNPKNNWLCCYL